MLSAVFLHVTAELTGKVAAVVCSFHRTSMPKVVKKELQARFPDTDEFLVRAYVCIGMCTCW